MPTDITPTVFKETLRIVGLKQTKVRIAILELLQIEKKPLSAGDILKLLSAKYLRPDQVTVYRILDILNKKKLVKKVYSPQSAVTKYELATGDHHHFTCDSCGAIVDIKNCNVDDLVSDIKKKEHVFIKGHTLEFFGLCGRCQA